MLNGDLQQMTTPLYPIFRKRINDAIEQVIKDYNKAIELGLQDAEAYVKRGIAYGKLGNDKQAIADI